MPIEVGGDPENIILEDVMPTGYYPTPSLGAKATRFPKGVYLAGLVKKQATSHALALEPTCCATVVPANGPHHRGVERFRRCIWVSRCGR